MDAALKEGIEEVANAELEIEQDVINDMADSNLGASNDTGKKNFKESNNYVHA